MISFLSLVAEQFRSELSLLLTPSLVLLDPIRKSLPAALLIAAVSV
jgi:hypothetical protein